MGGGEKVSSGNREGEGGVETDDGGEGLGGG